LRYFPVMDDDHLVGVVNESDLFHASIRSLIGHPKDGPRAPLGEVKVRDVMKPATTVSSNTSVHDAAELVVEHGIESVVVMEGEKIVGVVARTALLRELAKR